MLERYTRLLGTAMLLDALILVVTLPLTNLVIFLLVPPGYSSAGITFTYGLFVLAIVLGMVGFLLWMFEGYYKRAFSFWQLVITMFIFFAAVLFWSKWGTYLAL